MSTRSSYLRFLFVVVLGCSALLRAADSSAPPEAPKSEPARPDPSALLQTTTDPNYRLGAGDTVVFGVRGQPDLSDGQTISRNGDIRLPLITEEVLLAGKTVREAERFLQDLYRDKKLLKNPIVSLRVAAYYPRSVSVLGAVVNPGTVQFPPDTVSLDIVEVMTRVGGFRPIANSNRVTLTRRGPDGKETTRTLDLSDILSGRHRSGKDRLEVSIFPGDRIWVPESIF